jgi:hypothetical protein
MAITFGQLASTIIRRETHFADQNEANLCTKVLRDSIVSVLQQQLQPSVKRNDLSHTSSSSQGSSSCDHHNRCSAVTEQLLDKYLVAAVSLLQHGSIAWDRERQLPQEKRIAANVENQNRNDSNSKQSLPQQPSRPHEALAVIPPHQANIALSAPPPTFILDQKRFTAHCDHLAEWLCMYAEELRKIFLHVSPLSSSRWRAPSTRSVVQSYWKALCLLLLGRGQWKDFLVAMKEWSTTIVNVTTMTTSAGSGGGVETEPLKRWVHMLLHAIRLLQQQQQQSHTPTAAKGGVDSTSSFDASGSVTIFELCELTLCCSAVMDMSTTSLFVPAEVAQMLRLIVMAPLKQFGSDCLGLHRSRVTQAQAVLGNVLQLGGTTKKEDTNQKSSQRHPQQLQTALQETLAAMASRDGQAACLDSDEVFLPAVGVLQDGWWPVQPPSQEEDKQNTGRELVDQQGEVAKDVTEDFCRVLTSPIEYNDESRVFHVHSAAAIVARCTVAFRKLLDATERTFAVDVLVRALVIGAPGGGGGGSSSSSQRLLLLRDVGALVLRLASTIQPHCTAEQRQDGEDCVAALFLILQQLQALGSDSDAAAAEEKDREGRQRRQVQEEVEELLETWRGAIVARSSDVDETGNNEVPPAGTASCMETQRLQKAFERLQRLYTLNDTPSVAGDILSCWWQEIICRPAAPSSSSNQPHPHHHEHLNATSSSDAPRTVGDVVGGRDKKLIPFAFVVAVRLALPHLSSQEVIQYGLPLVVETWGRGGANSSSSSKSSMFAPEQRAAPPPSPPSSYHSLYYIPMEGIAAMVNSATCCNGDLRLMRRWWCMPLIAMGCQTTVMPPTATPFLNAVRSMQYIAAACCGHQEKEEDGKRQELLSRRPVGEADAILPPPPHSQPIDRCSSSNTRCVLSLRTLRRVALQMRSILLHEGGCLHALLWEGVLTEPTSEQCTRLRRTGSLRGDAAQVLAASWRPYRHTTHEQPLRALLRVGRALRSIVPPHNVIHHHHHHDDNHLSLSLQSLCSKEEALPLLSQRMAHAHEEAKLPVDTTASSPSACGGGNGGGGAPVAIVRIWTCPFTQSVYLQRKVPREVLSPLFSTTTATTTSTTLFSLPKVRLCHSASLRAMVEEVQAVERLNRTHLRTPAPFAVISSSSKAGSEEEEEEQVGGGGDGKLARTKTANPQPFPRNAIGVEHAEAAQPATRKENQEEMIREEDGGKGQSSNPQPPPLDAAVKAWRLEWWAQRGALNDRLAAVCQSMNRALFDDDGAQDAGGVEFAEPPPQGTRLPTPLLLDDPSPAPTTPFWLQCLCSPPPPTPEVSSTFWATAVQTHRFLMSRWTDGMVLADKPTATDGDGEATQQRIAGLWVLLGGLSFSMSKKNTSQGTGQGREEADEAQSYSLLRSQAVAALKELYGNVLRYVARDEVLVVAEDGDEGHSSSQPKVAAPQRLRSNVEVALDLAATRLLATAAAGTLHTDDPSGSQRPTPPRRLDVVYLELDNNLHGLPWEMCRPFQHVDVVRAVPRVKDPRHSSSSSSSSLACSSFSTAARPPHLPPSLSPSSSSCIPPSSSSHSVLCVLNADGNLPKSERRFTKYIEQTLQWSLRTATKQQQQARSSHSIPSVLVYMGHGHGEATLVSQPQELHEAVRDLVPPVVVLMGCSSVRVHGGTACRDPTGPLLRWLRAGSEAVVGCLWDVTDGEIDRCCASLLARWTGTAVPYPRHLREGPRMDAVGLAAAVRQSREACRYRYLTGAALVMYGCLPSKNKQQNEESKRVIRQFARRSSPFQKKKVHSAKPCSSQTSSPRSIGSSSASKRKLNDGVS